MSRRSALPERALSTHCGPSLSPNTGSLSPLRTPPPPLSLTCRRVTSNRKKETCCGRGKATFIGLARLWGAWILRSPPCPAHQPPAPQPTQASTAAAAATVCRRFGDLDEGLGLEEGGLTGETPRNGPNNDGSDSATAAVTVFRLPVPDARAALAQLRVFAEKDDGRCFPSKNAGNGRDNSAIRTAKPFRGQISTPENDTAGTETPGGGGGGGSRGKSGGSGVWVWLDEPAGETTLSLAWSAAAGVSDGAEVALFAPGETAVEVALPILCDVVYFSYHLSFSKRVRSVNPCGTYRTVRGTVRERVL